MTAGTARRHLGKSEEDFDGKETTYNVSDYTIFTSGIDDKMELRNFEASNLSVNDEKTASFKQAIKTKMNGITATEEIKRK